MGINMENESYCERLYSKKVLPEKYCFDTKLIIHITTVCSNQDFKISTDFFNFFNCFFFIYFDLISNQCFPSQCSLFAPMQAIKKSPLERLQTS